MIPQFSPLAWIKLGGGIALLLALAFLWHEWGYWQGQAKAARAENARICIAAADASGNPKLKCRDTAAQVRALGSSLASVTASLNRQNEAVAKLEKTTRDQQQLAAEAVSEARQRAKGAAAVSGDLIASSRAPERASKPCEPSKALQEAWHG